MSAERHVTWGSHQMRGGDAWVVDKITAKATNLTTGEVCRGTLGI
jgi:hypothetical protein